MAANLHIAALAGFGGLMLVAAIEDLRRLTIPNQLILALCALWPLYVLANPTLIEVLGALGCAAAVFVVGALCFARGYVGGGDVKLLAATALWAGPYSTLQLLMLTGVLGGVLALFLLMPPGAYIATLARAKLGPGPDADAESMTSTPVPYAIAIAGAAVIVIFVPHFR